MKALQIIDKRRNGCWFRCKRTKDSKNYNHLKNVLGKNRMWKCLQKKKKKCLQKRKSCSVTSKKDWCWSWHSNTLATWCEELTHLKRPWCWERLKAGGEGDDRGWDGWMALPTQWTWVWVNSRSWWWTGRPGVVQSMGLQRVGHDWATELRLLRKL